MFDPLTALSHELDKRGLDPETGPEQETTKGGLIIARATVASGVERNGRRVVITLRASRLGGRTLPVRYGLREEGADADFETGRTFDRAMRALALLHEAQALAEVTE